MLRIRLSLMMFFQYMIYKSWWFPLAAYLTNMGVQSTQKALILSSMAIGCMASPIIGMIADRHFAAQRVLFVLNVVVGFLLIVAARTNEPTMLFFVLLFTMLFYMPSWSLSSAIAMTHSPSEKFPRIRVFGSIGAVFAGLFSVISVKVFHIPFDGTNVTFYVGACVAFVAALSNLTLPYTPSKGKGAPSSFVDALGLRAAKYMKERNFAIFVILSFISMIPFAMYFAYFSEYLLDIKTEFMTVTMNWGVVAEMGFMLLIPVAIKKFGLRKVMIIGLIASIVRFVAFYLGGVFDQHWVVFIGILVHGLIFGFFYVGGQIYIDKKIVGNLKSQAQGFYFLVTFGLGMLVANIINGQIIRFFTDSSTGKRIYDWDSIWGLTTIFSIIILVAFIALFKNGIANEEPSTDQLEVVD